MMFLFFLLNINDGIILCRVIDGETHHPLPFANVMVVATETGGVTDSNGRVRISLKPGIYSIKATFIGYRGTVKSLIEVFPGKIT